MPRLFRDISTNPGRQYELDLARGFAVFFMVLVHVKMELPGFPLTDMYSMILEFCGSPLAAPVFMILLGAGIPYSQHSSPKTLAVRGGKLLALHYLLNILAFGLPRLLKFAITRDRAYWEGFLENTFSIDILAFAGLTFLFFAVLRKGRAKLVHILLITLVLSCLNFVFTHPLQSLWLRAITGLFVRTGAHAYFPFFAWIGYPVMGYAFGCLLKKCSDKQVFYRYLFAFSALTVAAISLGAQKYGFDVWSMQFGTEDYYYQDFLQYILVGGICFAWISLVYAVSKRKAFRVIGRQLARLSRNTTAIYFVHYIIIGWLAVFCLAAFPASPLFNLTIGMALVLLSDALVLLYKVFGRRATHQHEKIHR